MGGKINPADVALPWVPEKAFAGSGQWIPTHLIASEVPQLRSVKVQKTREAADKVIANLYDQAQSKSGGT